MNRCNFMLGIGALAAAPVLPWESVGPRNPRRRVAIKIHPGGQLSRPGEGLYAFINRMAIENPEAFEKTLIKPGDPMFNFFRGLGPCAPKPAAKREWAYPAPAKRI